MNTYTVGEIIEVTGEVFAFSNDVLVPLIGLQGCILQFPLDVDEGPYQRVDPNEHALVQLFDRTQTNVLALTVIQRQSQS